MADKPRVPVRDKRGAITGYRGGDYAGAMERSTRGGGLGAASARNKARKAEKPAEFEPMSPEAAEIVEPVKPRR